MTEDFGQIFPVVACAIVNDGRVLVLKRAIEPEIGRWAFPAGYVELGESAEAAIEREVLEETGINITSRYYRSFGKFGGDGRAYLSLMFRAESASDRVVLDDENSAHRWIPLNKRAIEALDWAFDNHLLVALELLD